MPKSNKNSKIWNFLTGYLEAIAQLCFAPWNPVDRFCDPRTLATEFVKTVLRSTKWKFLWNRKPHKNVLHHFRILISCLIYRFELKLWNIYVEFAIIRNVCEIQIKTREKFSSNDDFSSKRGSEARPSSPKTRPSRLGQKWPMARPSRLGSVVH